MNRTVKRNKSRKKEKKEEEIGLDNSYRKRGKNHNNGTSFRPTYVHVFVIGAMALTGFFLYNFLLKRGTGGNEKREYLLLSVFFLFFQLLITLSLPGGFRVRIMSESGFWGVRICLNPDFKIHDSRYYRVRIGL